MNKIEKRILEIRKCPALYLGHKSLRALKHYLNGYTDGVNQGNSENPEIFYPGFQEYIQSKYHITSSHSWAEIILFYIPSEEQAFDKFYELLDDFLETEK